MISNQRIIRKVADSKENVKVPGMTRTQILRQQSLALRDIGNKQGRNPTHQEKDTLSVLRVDQKPQQRHSSLLTHSIVSNVEKEPRKSELDVSKYVRPPLRRSDRLRSTLNPVEVKKEPEAEDVIEKSAIVRKRKLVAFSSSLIEDIDKGVEGDPQMAVEYVHDIYEYLRQLEVRYAIRPYYLSGQRLTGAMRATLIDWLAQVAYRFKLLPETLHTTVGIIDRYLQEVPIKKELLQLVGAASMFVACKYEEIFFPELNDFCYVTDGTYTSQQILEMEREILKKLGFELGRPLVLHFLRRYTRASKAAESVHVMSKYILESCLLDYGMCHVRPSLLSAAAHWLAMNLLIRSPEWTPTLVHYTSYEVGDMKEVLEQIGSLMHKIHFGRSKYQAVRNRYATARLKGISANSSITEYNLKKAVELGCNSAT